MDRRKARIASALVGVIAAVAFLFFYEEGHTQQMYHNEGKVFGTYYNIRYIASQDLEGEIKSAFQAFDNSLSMFNPHSILSAVNDNRDTTTNEAFETMWAEAESVYAISEGAFDITVAPLVQAFGFGRKSQQLTAISPQKIDSIRQFVGFEKVQLVDHKVIKSDPRVKIDGGAVAKGQACDMIASVLSEHGVENYLVDIGGEVVTHGEREPGEPWRIGITKPNMNNEGAQEDLQQVLAIHNIAMATSGNYRNYYYDGEQRRSHTIDPRTGWPVQHSLLSATVVSSSCMRADALATACMVVGAEKALEMIERAGDAACYLIVAENDSLIAIQSPKWAEMIAK